MADFAVRSYEGTHYEIGRLRGEELAPSLKAPPSSPGRREFARACRCEVERLHPPLVEQFEGLVDGGGFDREDFSVLYFARQQSMAAGCTVFAVTGQRSSAGGPIVGRNYDWLLSDLRWCECRVVRTSGFPARVGFTHHWWGNPDVIAQTGLCVFVASLPLAVPAAPGVQWSLLVDAVCELCTDVDQAAELLTSASHLRPMAYMVADGQAAAVVEALPGWTRVRRPENGLLVSTNAILTRTGNGELVPDEPAGGASGKEQERWPPSGRTQRALGRYLRVVELVGREAGPLSEGRVAEMLRDHEAPLCCGHQEPYTDFNWGTMWSTVAAPGRLRMRTSLGFACEADLRDVAAHVRTGSQ